MLMLEKTERDNRELTTQRNKQYWTQDTEQSQKMHNIEGAIKNEQFRDTSNNGHKTQNKDKKQNKTQDRRGNQDLTIQRNRQH
jgi:hypothetical protein